MSQPKDARGTASKASAAPRGSRRHAAGPGAPLEPGWRPGKPQTASCAVMCLMSGPDGSWSPGRLPGMSRAAAAVLLPTHPFVECLTRIDCKRLHSMPSTCGSLDGPGGRWTTQIPLIRTWPGPHAWARVRLARSRRPPDERRGDITWAEGARAKTKATAMNLIIVTFIGSDWYSRTEPA